MCCRQIEDPKSIPDVINEVKWHPETEDFIKSLGRWVETEDDLPGMRRTSDVAMDDQFNDLGDSFYRGGQEDDGDPLAALADEEVESSDTLGMDAEFE